MSDHGEKQDSKSSEKRWVKFDENTSDSQVDGVGAAVIDTETVFIKSLVLFVYVLLKMCMF